MAARSLCADFPFSVDDFLFRGILLLFVPEFNGLMDSVVDDVEVAAAVAG